MLEIIQHYYRYNAWATERVLDACQQLSPGEYNAPGCSGNGSIAETLSHLITVQWGWFAWFGKTMDMREAVGLMVKNKLTTLDEARAKWAEVNEQTNQLLAGLTDEALGEVWNFTRMNGKAEAQPLWKMMMHTANHGTHTRAQIVAAIRRAGHAPGNVDLLNYLLSVE